MRMQENLFVYSEIGYFLGLQCFISMHLTMCWATYDNSLSHLFFVYVFFGSILTVSCVNSMIFRSYAPVFGELILLIYIFHVWFFHCRCVTSMESCIVISNRRIFYLLIRRKVLPWRQLILGCRSSLGPVMHCIISNCMSLPAIYSFHLHSFYLILFLPEGFSFLQRSNLTR